MSSFDKHQEGWPGGLRWGASSLTYVLHKFKTRPRVFSFFTFSTNFPNFKGKYPVSVKFSKDELFTPKNRGSKVPLGMELDPAPPRPFEKNDINIRIFIK